MYKESQEAVMKGYLKEVSLFCGGTRVIAVIVATSLGPKGRLQNRLLFHLAHKVCVYMCDICVVLVLCEFVCGSLEMNSKSCITIRTCRTLLRIRCVAL